MARETPEEKARAQLLAQVLGAAAAAPGAGEHPGHWSLHHIALPAGPGDFTPQPAPEYVEEEYGVFAQLAEMLGVGELLGLDGGRGPLPAEAQAEAGQ
jgi:hypothetical protein